MKSVETNKVPFYNQLIQDYISGELLKKGAIGFKYNLESLLRFIDAKTLSLEKREILVERLKAQYHNSFSSELVQNNIELLLKEDTYTITTGHQLNLFGGPMFFVSKILDVVALCSKVQVSSGKSIVPVFWMATEDHDFEEIQSINLFNDKYTWEEESKGAVGRLSTDSLQKVLNLVLDRIGDDERSFWIAETISDSFSKSDSLANGMRTFVNALFGEYGVVVIDGDDKVLKAQFTAIAEKEIREQISFNSEKLQSDKLSGYKRQVNPREINLFYLTDNFRERLILENDIVSVLNSDLKWSVNDFVDHLKEFPERVSPNAIMRPVYQEVLLPNIAYVGGAGEIAYWLQMPEIFKSFKIEMPLPIVRTSYFYSNSKIEKQLLDVGLEYKDLISSSEDFEIMVGKLFVSEDFHLKEEQKELESIYNSLKEKGKAINVDLIKVVEGELKRNLSAFQNLEKRFANAEKRKHETSISKLVNIRKRLFPANKPQERFDSSIGVLASNGKVVIKNILEVSNPFDQDIKFLG